MFLSASPESLATVSAEQILSKLNLLPFLASHTPRTQTCFKPLTWEITVDPDPTKKRQPPEESPLSAGPIRSRRSQVSGNADRQEWGGGFCSPTGSQVVQVLPTTTELDR